MSLQLPEKPGDNREQAIRDLVCDGKAQYRFIEINSAHNGHSAQFRVFVDALQIEGVRVSMSAETQQVVADMLGCSLLTAKLADLLWAQRHVTLPPFPRGNPKGMSDTTAMIEHSAKIDAALEKLKYPDGIISTVGKHWIIDNSIADGRKLMGAPVACNYGWHFEKLFEGKRWERSASDPNERLIQGRGTRHNMKHDDYSQNCVLVSLDCVVDGGKMKLGALLQDPELAPLASHQGVLKCLRQPGVPELGITIRA